MKIVKLSNLSHAERFGTCAECGKNSDEAALYRIVTDTRAGSHTYHSSLCLCGKCMRILQKQMGEVMAEQNSRDDS